ncbi:MAG: hypothetical protein ACUVTE_00070 [Candidatus Bathycorpusculaceae bacterium]
MRINANIKGLSTLTVILIVIVSAIIGGIISYAFTIAYYTKIPEKTAIAVTGIYIDKENVQSFNVSILNPSYSPADATISRIAVSLKGETQLYDVTEMEPSIADGLVVPVGASLNITCLKIRKDSSNITFGEFVSNFAGKTIIVHVFSSDSSAANMESTLPLVKLDIATDFNPKISFKKFNITLTNALNSEVNLTVKDILVPGVEISGMDPDIRTQSKIIPRGESVCFRFNGSWHGIVKITLFVYTEQGYIFRKEVEMETVNAAIQNVTFDEDHTDHFNVTISNFAESANYINVTNIECTLENGTKLTLDCGSAVIMPNSTRTFKFNWDWRTYRGRNITLVAYFSQEFQTDSFRTETPQPIIIKVLNEAEAFNLKDRERFNITILNHEASLAAVNITKIVVKRTGEVLLITNGVINHGDNKTFTYTYNWTNFLNLYGRNLTLTIYAANQTLGEYTFDFSLTLPVAELNITVINHTTIGETGYLNLTVKNLGYSLWNLTLSKIVITIQDLAEPLEYVLPKNHVKVNIGGETVLLCPFDWQRYLGKSITVAVVTEELVEASTNYTIPNGSP